MNRNLLRILMVIIFVGISVPLIGCGSDSDQAEALEDQVMTVQRGDLIVDITAAGNLALSRTEDLSFDLFYEQGIVEEVLVEKGDLVEDGQVLATLDTSEWEKELMAMELDLLQAEINLKNAEIALEKAEDALLDTVESGDAIKQLERILESKLEDDPGGTAEILALQEQLREAWARFLKVASNSVALTEVKVKEMQLELAQANFEDAGGGTG